MITVTNVATIDKTILSKDALRNIKTDLSIPNPEVDKRNRLGLSMFGVLSTFKLYKECDTHIDVPVGYLEDAIAYIPNLTPDSIKDNRIVGEPISIKFTGTLREYQIDALNALSNRSIGIISAPTGSGKSIIMCKLIADKAVETLVLVNTKELANQFKANLLKFTDLLPDNINIIGGGNKYKKCAVNIALFQAMRTTVDPGLNTNVGLVLTDEVHITGASTYFSALMNLQAKLKFGFSATPEREDGLSALIYAASGKIRKVISLTEIKGSVILPKIVVIETNYHFPFFDMGDYQAMLSDLSLDKERNEFIAQALQPYKDKQTVLLCSRIIQCVLLHRLIPNSMMLIGGISKLDGAVVRRLFPNDYVDILAQRGIKHRRAVVEALSNGSLRTVISTYSLFSTGLDFPDLEVAAFCAPMKSKILVKQCRGRVMRLSNGKKPICIDFRDSKVGLLKTQSIIRTKILGKFD